MKNFIFASLILVLLVSGCSNPFSTDETQVKELPPDVLSIQNITVIPSNTVRTGDYFSVYFDVLNQDELDEVSDVVYDLYDTGLCQVMDGQPLPAGWRQGTPVTGTFDDSFAPRESKALEWNFQAPTEDKIANIGVTCPISFKFDFDYTAKSQIDVLVISRSHLLNLQRSGNPPAFAPTVNVGRGPIKIYFDFGATLPVRDSSTLPIYVKVQDKGTGLLKEITPGCFTIKFPSDFTVPDGTTTCPYFNCVDNDCTSNEAIPMINKKSLEIRCDNIKAPSGDAIGDLEKTYFISSTLGYNYYVAGSVDISVNP